MLRAEAGRGQAEGRGGEGSTAHRSPGDCRGLGLPALGRGRGARGGVSPGRKVHTRVQEGQGGREDKACRRVRAHTDTGKWAQPQVKTHAETRAANAHTHTVEQMHTPATHTWDTCWDRARHTAEGYE